MMGASCSPGENMSLRLDRQSRGGYPYLHVAGNPPERLRTLQE